MVNNELVNAISNTNGAERYLGGVGAYVMASAGEVATKSGWSKAAAVATLPLKVLAAPVVAPAVGGGVVYSAAKMLKRNNVLNQLDQVKALPKPGTMVATGVATVAVVAAAIAGVAYAICKHNSDD